jgi:hypothetical protein
VASGLVDDIANVSALDLRPYRCGEGHYVCHHGDSAECLWIIVTEPAEIRRAEIKRHPQCDVLWRNIAKNISLKLRDASIITFTLGR